MKMRMLWIGLLSLAFAGYFGWLSSHPAWGKYQEVAVFVDGQLLLLDQPAVLYQGRVMVPLRQVFESLGADVQYDAKYHLITAMRGSGKFANTMSLTLGSLMVEINDQPQLLETLPLNMEGRILVPLYLVNKVLGAQVSWQASDQTVSILSLTGGSNEPLPMATLQIQDITHNASQILIPGDTLTVSFRGKAGGKASFDIANVVNNVHMAEVSPGLYEGTYTVPTGIEATHSQVIGYLEADGKMSSLPAVEPVTIEGMYGTAARLRMSPSPGTEINVDNPRIAARFGSLIQPGTIKLYLDGVDYSSQAVLQENRVMWVPPFSLSNGEHTVEIYALGTAGEQLHRKWSFSINKF